MSDVERSNDAVIGNPLPCCRSKIVTMKPTIALQHQLSCRSAAPLLWQPHPFHDKSSLVSTERLSAWARNCLSVWRKVVTTHIHCNMKIGFKCALGPSWLPHIHRRRRQLLPRLSVLQMMLVHQIKSASLWLAFVLLCFSALQLASHVIDYWPNPEPWILLIVRRFMLAGNMVKF